MVIWDLGCCNGIVTGVGSCLHRLKREPSHRKPHTKHHLADKSEVFMNNKTSKTMINEMIKIICDSLEL